MGYMMKNKRYLVRVSDYFDTPDDQFIRKDFEVKFFSRKSDALKYIKVKRECFYRDNFVMMNDFFPNIDLIELK